MSVAEITARIQAIESRLALFAPPSVAGAAFASELSAANVRPAAGTEINGRSVSAQPSERAVVDQARKYLGVPYVWGGTNPQSGLDCSGLVQLVYKNLGYDLPRVSYQQADAGRPVSSLAQARPGDILAFNNPVNHVAIYIGDGKMIEAPRPGQDVRVSEVYQTPSAIRRILPEVSGATAGARAIAPTSGDFSLMLGRAQAGLPYNSADVSQVASLLADLER
jgi:cell wall-associated NlpC family hydrolase